MNIEELLSEMADLLNHSKSMPFASHRCIIDGDRMRELISEAQLNIPAEIKRANLIDSDCDRIIEESRQKAEHIIQDAETRAKRILDEDALIEKSKKCALQMLTDAQNSSNEIKGAARQYVEHMLCDAQDYFQNTLQEIQKTKESIAQVKNNN